MTLYGDYASIAATSAGVAGNITVPVDAHLVGLDLNWNDADGIPVKVEITGTGFPTPIKLTPNIIGQVQTGNSAGGGACRSPMIDLRPFGLIAKSTVVTLTITSTANVTVIAGLTWEAA